MTRISDLFFQIRLWGLDAQKRLRAARVLVAGMRGLGNEVTKNLVLAGVNSMTILDHEKMTKEDCVSSFLGKSHYKSKQTAAKIVNLQLSKM